MADHDSFIGPYDAYAVEEQVVRGAVPDAPLGEVAGPKVIVRYADAADIPPAPSDALCVIDQKILQNMMPGSPDLALVRSIWCAEGANVSAFGGDALVVSEVRQMVPSA
jgi:hypothetical protein